MEGFSGVNSDVEEDLIDYRILVAYCRHSVTVGLERWNMNISLKHYVHLTRIAGNCWAWAALKVLRETKGCRAVWQGPKVPSAQKRL